MLQERWFTIQYIFRAKSLTKPYNLYMSLLVAVVIFFMSGWNMSEKEGDFSENQHYKLVCWSTITAVTRMQWGIMQDGHIYCNIKTRREHWMTNLNILLVLISNPAPTIFLFWVGITPYPDFFYSGFKSKNY